MRQMEEGAKETVGFEVVDLDHPTVVPSLFSPERRVLDSAKALVPGFDWAACTWDAATGRLTWLFDSTAVGLSAPGVYYVNFRGTIGSEVVKRTVTVRVLEAGP